MCSLVEIRKSFTYDRGCIKKCANTRKRLYAAPALINIYCNHSEMYVASESILSRKGTTQGDPLSMAMHAFALKPLIHAVSAPVTQQVWFANDAAAGGHLD